MKRSVAIVLLTVFLISAVPPAFSATNTETFRYQSTIAVKLEKPAGHFMLDLDPQVYATVDPSLRDLRIYSAGQELGYTRMPHEPVETPVINHLPLEIINKGMLQGTNTYSFTLKIPPAKPGAVQIKLSQPEYLVKAGISGSNDNKAWQELNNQTLYGINGSYNKFYLAGIDYQYLKFEYDLLKKETLEITAAEIAEGALPKKTETPWEIKQSDDNNNKTTTVILDLGYNNRITRGVTLETGEKSFYREAALAAGNDMKNWNDVTSLYLYRGQDDRDENLSFNYPPVNGRYLRITVENEDNPPVIFSGAKVQLVPVRLLVKSAGTNFPLTLYWGNKDLPVPSYDVAYLLARSDFYVKDLPLVTVKDVKINDNFKEKLPPLTERIPILMPAALAIAAVLVGFILFRSFRHMEK